MDSNNRVECIDFVRGLAIISVTLGHVLGSYSFGYSKLCFFLYAFELPAFFIASGLIQERRKDRRSLKEYISNSFRKILYPYFTFSLLYTVIYTLLSVKAGISGMLSTAFNCFVYTASTYGLGALWFMPTFFAATVLAYIIWGGEGQKKRSRAFLSFLLIVGFGVVLSYYSYRFRSWNNTQSAEYTVLRYILWMGLSFLSRSLIGCSLVFIGRFFCIINTRIREEANQQEKTSRFKWKPWVFVLLAFLIGSVLALQQPEPVDLHFSFIWNPILFYSSACLIVIGLLVMGTMVRIRWIEYLGKISMIVMACQIIQELLCRFVNKYYNNTHDVGIGLYVIEIIITVTVVLLSSCVLASWIRKNKYLKLIIEPAKHSNGGKRI